ncbi:hypothetical protein J6590_050454 [Homalodisca vitripennis]|nr:hypothetical protein J6590_050454 [Homalodisca vitripennis]
MHFSGSGSLQKHLAPTLCGKLAAQTVWRGVWRRFTRARVLCSCTADPSVTATLLNFANIIVSKIYNDGSVKRFNSLKAILHDSRFFSPASTRTARFCNTNTLLICASVAEPQTSRPYLKRDSTRLNERAVYKFKKKLVTVFGKLGHEEYSRRQRLAYTVDMSSPAESSTVPLENPRAMSSAYITSWLCGTAWGKLFTYRL